MLFVHVKVLPVALLVKFEAATWAPSQTSIELGGFITKAGSIIKVSCAVVDEQGAAR